MAVSLFRKAKGFVTRSVLDRAVEKVRKGEMGDLADMLESIGRLAPARYHREALCRMAKMVRSEDPSVAFLVRAVRELSPLALENMIRNLIVNFMVLGRGVREEKEAELGVHLPNFMVISPTMKCNLHCTGCYAGEYDRGGELTFEELDDLLIQGKELGMYFYTLSGGEVLLYPRIFDLWKKHDDCYFQFYTNGTLLDDGTVDRMAALGNVAPMVSVEGTEDQTDARRGRGTYRKVLEAFSRMREQGMLFGFSATCTSLNSDYLASDEFIGSMVERGCMVGWFFQYVPIGVSPDLTYMASPEQRAALHDSVSRWRSSGEYPIFTGDFWNDGPYVDGCMAGGSRYWHVISDGRVEPCVFVPFAADSIREKSLVDIARSPFFSAIRSAQPYDGDDDLLCPCMILDHPRVLRVLIDRFDAKPCHPGLERMLSGSVAEGLDDYGKAIRSLYRPLWEGCERERYLKRNSEGDSLVIK
ncbi:radical SAM protein [Dethiosulfovibrio sp. F2B]|uniref:radical SAM protein n=1 Tax=Dethiosulfovibrio faecalis TaxID=2720018 RepID=UPI001F3AD450|nr:radical SAM protein [Dethiosulfovibrio faecalis]MCF4152396.1 radical SAM protein [Dethiosulfovibrio faecalis]